ncbi:MAG TPA: ABC transporter ATP-binding protein [Clostridia bacterium]|nr:ABC transporter ATP-binding protein [Clostridia bacterium]
METVMIAANVTKQYKNGRGVKNATLSLNRGEIHVLLGANGAGKSTLMKMLAGLMEPDSGEVYYVEDGGKSPDVRSRLYHGGFLVEQPEPFGYLTAFENLMQKGRYYTGGSESAEKALQLTGLKKHRNERAAAFSTGMKQRLGLAVALTGNPEFLVLDEPTNGMDIEGRADIHNLLKELKNEGVSIFLSTHLVHDAESIADRITVIHEGTMLESGLKDDLLKGIDSLESWYLKRIRENTCRSEVAV